MLHSGSAAVVHLLRPLRPADKLSTKTKESVPLFYDGEVNTQELLGGFSRTKTGETPGCFCLCAVTWLPVLPGNLLFTETTEQNVTRLRGRQLHLCLHPAHPQLKPLLAV